MEDAFDPFDPDEWGEKPGCGAFETALEMRAQGALPDSARSVLEAHLAACESCRQYESRSARVSDLLHAPVVPPDWLRLRQNFGKRLKRARLIPVVLAGWILLVLGAFSALTWLSTGQPPSWRILSASFLVTMLMIACGVYIGIRRLRRMLTDPDPVAAERRALEMALKNARAGGWLLPLSLVFTLLRVLGGHTHVNLGGGPLLVLWLLGAAGVGYLIIWQRRHRRRIERELAELH